MKKSSKIIIAILVLVNLTSLFFLWKRKPHPPKHDKSLIEVLGINDSSGHLKSLEENHHTNKRALMETNRKLNLELIESIGTSEQTDSLEVEIGKNYLEIQSMTFDFFNEIASSCNENQKSELKKELGRIFNHIHPKKGK